MMGIPHSPNQKCIPRGQIPTQGRNHQLGDLQSMLLKTFHFLSLEKPLLDRVRIGVRHLPCGHPGSPWHLKLSLSTAKRHP